MVDIPARPTGAYVLVDPAAELHFANDWSASLASLSPAGAIVSQQWTITPLDTTSPDSPALANPTAATVTVSGMLAGKVYRLTEQVTTEGGLVDERTIVVRCEQT